MMRGLYPSTKQHSKLGNIAFYFHQRPILSTYISLKVGDNNTLSLRRNHPYFLQTQIQMHLSGSKYCDFVVLAKNGSLHWMWICTAIYLVSWSLYKCLLITCTKHLQETILKRRNTSSSASLNLFHCILDIHVNKSVQSLYSSIRGEIWHEYDIVHIDIKYTMVDICTVINSQDI